jgi:hypothetical protein
MSLLVPPEFIKLVNKYSGQIRPDSPYHGKNLKGLFRSPPNQKYLAKCLIGLTTDFTFVQKNMPMPTEDYRDYNDYGIRSGKDNNISKEDVLRLINAIKSKKDFIESNIEDLIEMTTIPYKEDIVLTNPIQQLHTLNHYFLTTTSKNIIQNPTMFIPNFYAINPETGEDESNIEYDYNSESYSDGVWHPEHLFTNSKRNKGGAYWEPIELNYYSNPNSTGPGHRYNSKQYAATERTRSQFPRWQYSVEDKPYERAQDESLREGGRSDRRTQRNRGYDMSRLVSKSTY